MNDWLLRNAVSLCFLAFYHQYSCSSLEFLNETVFLPLFFVAFEPVVSMLVFARFSTADSQQEK